MNNEADRATRRQLHQQLASLQGRINYATNYARDLTRRGEHAKAKAWTDRAAAAQAERDELKAKHFGSAHPRFHLEPTQRKKAATEARMAQRRKDHGYE